MSELVTLSRESGIATVTVDRPEKRNALNLEARRQVRATIEDVVEDERSSVLVLRGKGPDAFIAGGDIELMAEFDAIDGLEYLSEHAQGLYNYVANVPLTTVAAIDGYAFGGGLEIALACDLRVASASAELGLPEVGMGLLPGGGGTQRLTRVAGIGVAKDLILTGRSVRADEALELGVVHRVYDDDEFEGKVEQFCARLQNQAPLARRLAKTAIDATYENAGFDVERLAGALLFGTDDFDEGVTAFLRDRQPEFQGE